MRSRTTRTLSITSRHGVKPRPERRLFRGDRAPLSGVRLADLRNATPGPRASTIQRRFDCGTATLIPIVRGYEGRFLQFYEKRRFRVGELHQNPRSPPREGLA